MSKAEDRALEAYPYAEICREKYLEGYRQAEKDLELTWENMFDIFRLVNEVLDDDWIEGKTKKEVGEEILKRFKERKEK